jgi:hypothetical protein
LQRREGNMDRGEYGLERGVKGLEKIKGIGS